MADMGFCQDEWSSRGDYTFGQLINNTQFKRKFRWKLIIPDISASGIHSLPPSRSARPNITLKDMTAEHLNETIYFPSKPDWKPLQLTLYDLCKKDQFGPFPDDDVAVENPVFTWLRRQYDTRPENCAYWKPALGNPPTFSDPQQSTGFQNAKNFKAAQVSLIMFDGCGEASEVWVYEHVWPQTIDWGDLDMSSSDVATVDVTLRYDRAYIETPEVPLQHLNYPEELTNFQCTPSQIPSFVPPSVIPLWDGQYGVAAESEEVEFKQVIW